jgi:hypothetical protein
MQIESDADGMAEFQDAKAEALLLSLGVLTKFRTLEEDQPRTQVVLYTTHPTHYIFARRFSGMDDPKENGYVAICFAKSKFTKAKFELVVARALDQGSQSIEETRGFGDAPPAN